MFTAKVILVQVVVSIRGTPTIMVQVAVSIRGTPTIIYIKTISIVQLVVPPLQSYLSQ